MSSGTNINTPTTRKQETPLIKAAQCVGVSISDLSSFFILVKFCIRYGHLEVVRYLIDRCLVVSTFNTQNLL